MQQKRTQVMHNVMTEQARQQVLLARGGRSTGSRDVEQLRNVCCHATEWAQQRAHDLGINDARELGFPVVVLDLEQAASSSLWGHDSNVSQTPSLCASSSYSGSSSSGMSISPTITTTGRKHVLAPPQVSTASPRPLVKPCLQPTRMHHHTAAAASSSSSTAAAASSMSSSCAAQQLCDPQQQQQPHQHP